MNEEEKKALKVINTRTKRLLDEPKIAYLMQEIRANKTILNLIEKLQKENEELKEYIVIAPDLDEMTAIKYRNIRRDAYLQGRVEEQQKAEQIINENYISKEKVKDKIEELNNISNAEELEDIMIGKNYTITELVQYVLQELIEESEEK
jgi:cell division protein FtsX